MSFWRLVSNRSVHCIHNHVTKGSNSWSLKIKCFHTINWSNSSNSIKARQSRSRLAINSVISYRCLSSIKTDTTIDFKPEITEQTIDLSDSIIASPLLQTAADGSDLPLTALNLASNWTPVGWTLHLLDLLHQALPWYATIAVATLIIRIAMFPLVIKAQRNSMKMNEIMPKMQELQQKATNARLSGNQLEFAKYTMESQQLLQQKGVNPLKNMLVPLAQAPVFVSFFLCLRRMARLPVDSLKVGGILWFVDLTVPDPYHLLPLITCASLWASLELGVEAGVNTNQSVFIKTFVRAMPVVTCIFIWNFESAILMYWCSSNFISLLQVLLLKQKSIRNYLGIPAQIKHKPEDLPVKKKGFYASIKESMDNSKVYRKLEERKRIDEINFKRAAIGPIKKTYKTDPTKVNTNTSSKN